MHLHLKTEQVIIIYFKLMYVHMLDFSLSGIAECVWLLVFRIIILYLQITNFECPHNAHSLLLSYITITAQKYYLILSQSSSHFALFLPTGLACWW